MSFNEFLSTKKIDHGRLKLRDLKLYNTLDKEYNILGEINFDFNKKYLFNNLRLLYPLKNDK